MGRDFYPIVALSNVVERPRSELAPVITTTPSIVAKARLTPETFGISFPKGFRPKKKNNE